LIIVSSEFLVVLLTSLYLNNSERNLIIPLFLVFSLVMTISTKLPIKFMIITNNKIILFRAVEFFEDSPANSSAPSSPPPILNFIPNYEVGGDIINNINNFNDQNYSNPKFFKY